MKGKYDVELMILGIVLLSLPPILLVILAVLSAVSHRFRHVLVESVKAMLIAIVSCNGTLALSAVYVISPANLIPDMIPALGWIDDLGVVMLAGGCGGMDWTNMLCDC